MIAASLGERIVASDDWYGSPSFIDGTVTESVQEWTELLSMHAAAMEAGTPLDTPRMRKALLNGGVPPSMRAKVWLAFSGAGKRMRSHPNVYAQLCKNVAAHFEGGAGTTAQEAQGGPEADSTCVEGAVGTAGSSSSGGGSGGGSSSGSQQIAHRVLEQVEKDLRRTDVGENGTEKLGAMRRVLCAFAAFNPDVGYVQGMNFIVVALLGVFDEAASFWMLALIVEVRPPPSPASAPPRAPARLQPVHGGVDRLPVASMNERAHLRRPVHGGAHFQGSQTRSDRFQEGPLHTAMHQKPPQGATPLSIEEP